MHAISIKMGLWMLAGLISFFLLMYTVGLGYRTELHLFNGVIQLFCLYWAIRYYYRRSPDDRDTYMAGVAQGMWTSAIGIGGFTVFMMIFITMEPKFLETLRQNSQMGEYLTPITASLFILVEGLMVSLIGSYILTRILLDVTFKKA